jgi:hypothetical protein
MWLDGLDETVVRGDFDALYFIVSARPYLIFSIFKSLILESCILHEFGCHLSYL